MTGNSVAGDLRRYLQLLSRSYQAMQRDAPTGGEVQLSLTLALTALDYWLLRRSESNPLQVAVIGPTQVGKSTLVNLLLGAEEAEASPLAAFTDRLHGFVQSSNDQDFGWIRDVLVEPGLVLEPVGRQDEVTSIVWDTPDFDSHRSHEYRAVIEKICALADLFVLVVSKEKYSDLSVWRTLEALQPLNRRLVVCLNKAPPDPAVLLEALRARLTDSGWAGMDVPIVSLPYVPAASAYNGLADSAQVRELRQIVINPVNGCGNERRFGGMRAFIEANWEEWLHPVRVEIDAVKRWRDEVDQALQAALADYQEQYLDHARHYDAFDRAVLQLLELLEIPGVARPLSKVRKVLTWPVRRITSAFGSGDSAVREISEATILNDAVEHVLLSLHRTMSGHDAESAQAELWWRTLRRSYDAEAEVIRREFSSGVARYRAEFAPEIDRAARSLYARLQQNPLVLNSLRATRLGADTAGVIIAVNTGTVGISDALLTPAMLSLTSALTESAVGGYAKSVRDQLKQLQHSLVRELLWQVVREPLINIGRRLHNDALFNIDENKLARIERAKRDTFE